MRVWLHAYHILNGVETWPSKEATEADLYRNVTAELFRGLRGRDDPAARRAAWEQAWRDGRSKARAEKSHAYAGIQDRHGAWIPVLREFYGDHIPVAVLRHLEAGLYPPDRQGKVRIELKRLMASVGRSSRLEEGKVPEPTTAADYRHLSKATYLDGFAGSVHYQDLQQLEVVKLVD